MDENALIIKHANMMLTLINCNLNCRLCSACISYEIEKKVHSILELKEMLKSFFEMVSFVEILDIIGGEPLLYPYLPEFFNELYPYREQIGLVKIVSNGSIVPKKSLIDAVKGYGDKFFYFVDNYGKELSSQIPQIKKVLEEAGISHKIRDYYSENLHCGGWVDFGDVRIKKHSKEEAKALFARCAVSSKSQFCFSISNGKMFACTPVRRRFELGMDVNREEYIDLMDKEMPVEKKRQMVRKIYNTDCLSACEYCNGMCEESPRFKPAEQLTKEEMKQIREGKIFR